MEYRKLGSTDLQVSRIVFGAGAVGGVVFKPDLETRRAAIQKALDYGINWIDTAPLYGRGQSEENLGRILQELDATPYVSTKVRLWPEDMDDIRGAIVRSMAHSLERLRRDRVVLIQLHNRVCEARNSERGAIALDDVFDDNGVVRGFEDLRRAGLADWFGFTATGDTGCLHTMLASGYFQTAQVYFNLLNPSAGWPVPPAFTAHDYRQLIDVARAHDVGVLCIRVLAAGALAGKVLTGSGRPVSPGSDAALENARVQALLEALSLEDSSLYETALRFVLMKEGVSGTLIGFSTLEHIDRAIEVMRMPPLSRKVIAVLERAYASEPFSSDTRLNDMEHKE